MEQSATFRHMREYVDLRVAQARLLVRRGVRLVTIFLVWLTFTMADALGLDPPGGWKIAWLAPALVVYVAWSVAAILTVGREALRTIRTQARVQVIADHVCPYWVALAASLLLGGVAGFHLGDGWYAGIFSGLLVSAAILVGTSTIAHSFLLLELTKQARQVSGESLMPPPNSRSQSTPPPA